MPLFKKSKDDSARQAELELQQSTLDMIEHDPRASSSSLRHAPAPTWYTPTSIHGVPVRSSTPRTQGLSPAASSRTTSPTFSNRSTLPRSAPLVNITPNYTSSGRADEKSRTPSVSSHASLAQRAKTRPSSSGEPQELDQKRTLSSSRASLVPKTRTRSSSPGEPRKEPNQRRTPSGSVSSHASLVPKTRTWSPPPKLPSEIMDQKQNSSILSKLSNLKLPRPRISKDAPDAKSPPANDRSRSKGASPSPWAIKLHDQTETPIVRVITRDGEVSNYTSPAKPSQQTKQIPVDQLTPNFRPRPNKIPKISRKVQTDPVDENFQLIPQKEDPDWVKTYEKYKRPIWVVFAIVIIGLAAIIALAATDDSSDDYNGAFAKFLGGSCSHFCRHSETFAETPLIVLALDGFRFNYLDRYRRNLPNLRRLSECGVTADLRPSFPATTAPNLWTIVSGYFPQFHGIVSDWIFDHRTGEEFTPRANPTQAGTRDAGWFRHPALWQLAEEQGKITASHSWLGNNLGIVVDEQHPRGEKRSPTYYKSFGRSSSYMSRLETVLEWLSLPNHQRPTFITVYFEDPGRTGRTYGAISDEVGDILSEIDDAIGHLFDELLRQQIVDCVNFMVVSTSGLVDTHCDEVYYLADDIDNLGNFIISPDYLGSMARITPKESAPDDIDTNAELVEHLQCKVDHGQTYVTDFLPSRLHGSYGHYLEKALVLMNDGWTFAKQQTDYDRSQCRGANDGYDPFSENMTGTFIAFGKDFKIGQTIKPFQNIELFNLMADLIGVEPSTKSPPRDGTPGYLRNVLKQPGPDPPLPLGLAAARNDRCLYPEQRRIADDGCTCLAEALSMYPETTSINVTQKDTNLDLIESPGSSFNRNAPFGLPGIKAGINKDGEYFCVLHQNDYITVYDDFLEIPLFVSYTITSTTGSVPVLENCRRYDQRLDPTKSQMCSEYYNGFMAEYLLIEPAFLFQPELAGNIDAEFDTLITSNMVPQYTTFTEKIWKPLATRIRTWASDATHIHVVAGVAYDMNRDLTKDRYFDIGDSHLWVGDTPVPTHFFVVATRCGMNNSDTSAKLKDCAYDQIATTAYIFPHTRDIPECFNFDEYLFNNRASLRDVERLSGLVFLPDWTMDSRTQMEMLRFKTQYADTNSPWVEV